MYTVNKYLYLYEGGGVPYSSMEIESIGDFDITTFGAEVCHMSILKAGRGVPGLAGPLEELNKAILYEKRYV